MANTLNLDLPDFVDQHSLGHEGIVDRILGQYHGNPALAVRLIDDAARFPSVVERFLQVAADLATFSADLRRAPPSVPYAKVPEILFHGRDNRGDAVIVIALPQGGDVLQMKDSGSWSQEKALQVAAQIAETLRIANQRGLYCCALIPSSIFIAHAKDTSPKASKAEVALLNIGLTQIESGFALATGQQSIGLIDDDLVYRAPELRKDPTHVNEQAEVYSLAALLHFLILGRLRARLTTTVKAGVHDDVLSLILGMLRPQPIERPPLQQVQQRILEILAKLDDFQVNHTCWATSECSLHAALQCSTNREGWLRMLAKSTSAAQRAQIEAVAQVLQQSSQPGTVPTLETGEQTDQSPYIFSAKQGTQTLAECVEKHGPMGRSALGIVENIARTVRSLQREGILYLGLCPDNIVIQKQEQLPKVFESAKLPQCWLLQTEYTQTLRKTTGTKARTLVEDSRVRPPAQLEPYLAPELYEPTSMVGDRADVFPLGSLLCFLLTGQPPPMRTVELPSELGIHPHLHERLLRLINRLRARRPVDRPTPDEAVRTLTWLARLDDLLQGELLDGRYQIERPLAQGGMNALFVVRDSQLSRHAVLKCPFPDLPIAIARARQEAESTIQARRGNPSVVNIIQYGELDPEVPYVLMEMVEGETLTERLRSQNTTRSMVDVIAFGIAMADVMSKIHEKGVLHRDLKPDNIMLEKDPSSLSGERVRILDFGIARVMVEQYAERRRLTGVGSFMGTPDYMAPEQSDAARATDKADVFSLGVILYEMLGGPLPAAHPLQKVADPDLMRLIGEMLAMVASVRPTMAEVSVRLRVLQKAKPIPLLTWVSVTSLCLGIGLTAWNINRDPGPKRAQLPQDFAIAADFMPKPVPIHVPQDMSGDLRDFPIPVPPVPGPPRPKPLPHPVLIPKPRICRITEQCIHGDGLTIEQKKLIAQQANIHGLLVCGKSKITMTKFLWYVPEPNNELTQRFLTDLRSYWKIRGYEKAVSPKEIVLSCH